MNKGITTKAALCPNCNQFHLICSIDLFMEDKETREDFAQYVIDGFQIINVTTQEAKARFGSC